MAFGKSTLLIGALNFASQVAAHGVVTGIVADDVYYLGYSPSFQYQQTPPTVAGWSIPEDKDTGYVSDYTSPDIICHKGATPGQTYAKVSAGGKVSLQWTTWPESHHGPVMDYLANCNGECTDVDKTKLLFNKIDEGGLNNGSPAPGNWASDDLIANNNTWTVTIPTSIAPGKYVLRHEIIALHSANNIDGAQNYPQCVNLEITGSGSDSLTSGTKGTDLYKDTDAGLYVNIYYPPLQNYTIPGPPVMDGGSSGSHPSNSTASVSATAPYSNSTVAPHGNPTTTITGTSTFTTFKTVTGQPTNTEAPDAGYGSGSEGGGDETTPSVSVSATPTQPQQIPDTTTAASFTTTVSHPADTSSPATDGPPPPIGTGKPRKFVCYEVED